MTWRVVHVSYGEQMRLKLDSLLVIKQGSKVTVPLSDISVIVAEGGDTVVTLRLLSALSKYNISFVVCDNEHLPTGIYHAYNGHFRAYKRLQAQLGWTEEVKAVLWQKIVEMKLRNQIDSLILLDKDSSSIELLFEYMSEIELADRSNREGHAAKVYFNALFGKKFTRVTQKEADAVNSALNYGYTIFRAQMARLVSGYGLNPVLGTFHRNEYNQFNLVDDLMEPFRQFVDVWVYLNMLESDYLHYEDRLKLTNLLNIRVKYGNELCNMTVAMDKYIKAFMKCIESNGEAVIDYPIISSVNWSNLDEV